MRTRRTRQRELILGIVRSTMDHPTAEWVYRQARRHLRRISLGTVYRNLKELCDERSIRELHTGGEPARFDGNTGHHYHIRCVACGRVNDLPIPVDSRFEEEAGRAMSYRVLSHQVEVQGVCPSCQSDVSDENESRHSIERATRPARATGR